MYDQSKSYPKAKNKSRAAEADLSTAAVISRQNTHSVAPVKMQDDSSATISIFDKLMTMKRAAAVTGINYVTIQRAVKAGTIPAYSLPGHKRKRIRIRDIYAAFGLNLDQSTEPPSAFPTWPLPFNSGK